MSHTECPVCVSPLNSGLGEDSTELADMMKNHGTRRHEEGSKEHGETMKTPRNTAVSYCGSEKGSSCPAGQDEDLEDGLVGVFPHCLMKCML
jgi:hypothetical protein